MLKKNQTCSEETKPFVIYFRNDEGRCIASGSDEAHRG